MSGRPGGMQTVAGYTKPAGYTQVTNVAAAVGLGTIPAESRLAIIQPEAQNVRWRDDGSNPTTSVGMILVANDILIYAGDFSAIKFIEVIAGAKLNISFYK